MPREPFTPTHRLQVMWPGGILLHIEVRLDADRNGFGPAASRAAWEDGGEPDFYFTASRWMAMDAGVRVVRVERLRPSTGR